VPVNYYISEEYVLAIQSYCAAHCRCDNHDHLDGPSKRGGAETLPLSVLESCVAAINAKGGGYWGFCIYNDEERSNLLQHVVYHSGSIPEAIDAVMGYNRLFTNALELTTGATPDGGLESEIVLKAPLSPVSSFILNAILGAGTLNLAEFLTELDLLQLPEGALQDEVKIRNELQRLGLVSVRDESATRRHFVCHPDLVKQEIDNRDHRLRRLLTRELDKQVSRIPDPDSLAESIEHYLSQNIERGVDLDAVCEHFHKSRRTLSRQLQKEGTGFVAIRDKVRRQRVMELINRPGLPLKQIAKMSGFNSLSAFNQAFIQWTGKSPGVYRGENSLY
jgi:AraC-like DNA-binding protein